MPLVTGCKWCSYVVDLMSLDPNEQRSSIKIGAGAYGASENFSYGNIFQVEKTTGPDRLIIAPDKHQVDILLSLAQLWNRDYFLLYVLLVSRLGHFAGRYESAILLTFKETEHFCTTFKAFLETDGRHHFWIGSISNDSMLIYDQHNIIYAYGDLDRYIELLRQRGFKAGQVRIPAPHSHNFHAENDRFEDKIIEYWEWKYLPLQPGDDY